MCSHQADLDHASVSECVVKCMKSIVCSGARSMLWPLLNYDSELEGGGHLSTVRAQPRSTHVVQLQ